MTDIVKRLRFAANEPIGQHRTIEDQLMDDAADEIERLRAERDELLALLCRARPYVEQNDSGLTRKGADDFALLERIDATLAKEGK